MKEKITKILKSKRGGQILVILGIVGMALIYLSSGISKKSENGESIKTEDSFSVVEYTKSLEQQVREIVAAVSGDSNAVVTVTLEGGMTYVYAEDKKLNNKTEENDKAEASEQKFIIVKDKDGDEHPLVVTTKFPSVKGVAIVCGPMGEATTEKIQNAVMAALGITQRKIYIAHRTQ